MLRSGTPPVSDQVNMRIRYMKNRLQRYVQRVFSVKIAQIRVFCLRLSYHAQRLMKTIGFRVNPNQVTYAVLDSDVNTVVVVDKINVPKALTTPEALKFMRSTVLDVLREYEIEQAGIRVAEHTQHAPSVQRIQIEGVIQEALASSTVLAYFASQIALISAKVGIERTTFKKIVSGEDDFDQIANWKDHSEEEREALLTALGAMNA
jgi:Holliday junction resolvasome RuvABC endonuclease subunit